MELKNVRDLSRLKFIQCLANLIFVRMTGIAKVSELSFIEASNLIQELDEMEKNSEMGILDEDDYYTEIGEDIPW